jgi:anti-sigma B factor antagonist
LKDQEVKVVSLKTSTDVRQNVAIVRLAGDITLGEASGQLRDAVKETLAAGHKAVLLDLGGVAYIDSAGLGELVGCYATASKHEATLKLLNLQKKVQGLMQITKLTTVFETFENEADAIRSLQGAGTAGKLD